MGETKHNLLHGEHSHEARMKKKRMLWIRNGLLIFLGLVIVAMAVLIIPSVGAMRVLYTNAQAGRDDLFRARDAAVRLDFDEASVALSDAVISFEVAGDAANRLGLIAEMPVFRREVQAVRELLTGGRNTALALREAVDVGADVLSVFSLGIDSSSSLPSFEGDSRKISELTTEERRLLLQKMTEAPDRLGMARVALDDALAAFARIPKTAFTTPILEVIEPHIVQLEQLRGALSRDLSLISQVPLMIGYPEPKTYLFLLLNNTELRPGGGFIGTYGIVNVADGDIKDFFTDDIYAIDGPAEGVLQIEPPEPLKRYLRSSGWFMRDANWSPDFVVSAMNVERFYHLENGPVRDIDGIFGVTPTVIERLLEVTGPITVDDTTFTSENVTDELEYQVERGFVLEGIPLAQRKEIVGQLGEELVARLLSLPLSELQTLFAIAENAIEEKHIMLSFKDAFLQNIADERDWSGRFRVASGDQLAIIDANLASLKSDPVVDRTVRYSVRPDGDTYIARAEMEYRHHGTFNWKTTRYRTYTRFYTPLGSQFLKGEGMMVDDKLNDPARRPGTIDVTEELGRTVFGGFISIEPGETRTLAVEYRVAKQVADMIRSGQYELMVNKQLGTVAHGLTLDLDFDKNVTRATPPEPPEEWGDDRYRVSSDLRLDRQFVIDLAL